MKRIKMLGWEDGGWRRQRLAVLAVASLWLAACAPLSPEPAPEPAPPAPAAEPAPGPTAEPGRAAPEVVEAPLSPALLALLDRAAELTAVGEHDDAAAAVERALRLAPERPELWYRLALVRLAQGDWGGAEAMAMRSLDRDETGFWRRANWRLIAQARRQAGDREGAREAEARLRAG